MKRKYDKKEDIPKGLEEYYSESNGVFVLKAIEGLKPIEDFERVQNELTEAKKSVTEFEKKFGSYKDWDFSDVQKKLDKLKEFETKSDGKNLKDDEKVTELVKIKTAELQREIERLQKEYEAANTDRQSLKSEKVKNLLSSKIRELVYDKDKGQYKVYEGSIPDIELNAMQALEYNDDLKDFITKDDKKLKLSEWFDPIAKERQWYKGSRGDGDPGSGNKFKSSGTESGTVQDVISEIWKQ